MRQDICSEADVKELEFICPACGRNDLKQIAGIGCLRHKNESEVSA